MINGQTYPSLQAHFRYAEQVFRMTSVELPIAFGLGDGHGGNIMVTEAGIEGKLLFIDYEVSGFQSPLLDMAKSIYLNAFCQINQVT
jgi:thiamine kinase-like enzyme